MGSQRLSNQVEEHVQPISFAMQDGVVLRGQRRGAGDDWVLLIHDLDRDLDAWGDLPAVLADDGYAVVAMDLPGHGLSDDPGANAWLVPTIGAMLDWLAAWAKSVFVVAEGSSAGAFLSVAGGHRVAALVALSPATGDDRDVRCSGSCPKLIMVGAANREAVKRADKVFRACGGWTVRSSFPVAEQGADLVRSSWGAHVVEQILLFFRDYRPAAS